MKSNKISSFANLTFYPMTSPNTGCIATGKLPSGYDLTITGGNLGQYADGSELYLVEVSQTNPKTDETNVFTKRNMTREELSILIEHHVKNRFKKRNNYNKKHAR